MGALWPSKKGRLFLGGEVFFSLPARHLFGGTCPLMGDPFLLNINKWENETDSEVRFKRKGLL